MKQQLKKNSLTRSPTLETVLMVEKAIEKHSGKFNRTQLWKSLPKKVMWQTYLIILDYLITINKIAINSANKISYIWNPKARKFFSKKEGIEL